MKKMTKKQKAAMLASLMGGCMISSNVLAANLIAGVPSDYGTSQLGAVTGSYVTTAVDQDPVAGVVTELNRDPSVFNVMVNGKSMIFLRQYTYSTTALKNSQLFDSDGDWANEAISGTVEKAPNAHAAAAYGNYIYVADYDLGNIGVARIGSDSLIEDTSKAISLKDDIVNKCGGSFDNEYAWVHGEGLLVKDNYLYVTVNVNPEGGYETYEPSYLIQYEIKTDGSLNYVNHTRVGKNTDVVMMNLYNNMIITSGIGGMQQYGTSIGDGTVDGEGGTIGNEDTSIDISFINANTLNSESQKVVVPETVKERGLDFRGVKVLPNGTAYVLTYNLSGSGGGSTMYVYKTTLSNLLTENPQDWEVVIKKDVSGSTEDQNGAGWFNKIDAEYYTKRVWAEIGDSLVVYTDGADTPTYTWLTKDFSTNEQLYKWNAVITLKPDMVTGDTAVLTESKLEGLTSPSETVIKTVNQNATNLKGDYAFGITGTDSDTAYSAVTNDNASYLFDSDKVINLPLIREGDLENNVLAAIYAHSGNDITVDSGDYTLQLQSKNYIASPVGIYAGNGKDVTVTAGKLNIITAGYEGGNSLTNAIWNDAGENTSSTITINAPVNISMSGGYGGNGIAVQKTDRWGEASYTADTASQIIINGDVSIKGADSETWGIPINAENVFSRFNNAGILTSVEKSKVTINGNVDFDIYGNGITTNAADSVVTIGGGQITVPTGMNYGYYTLASYLGTINVNTGENGTTAGTQDVQLNGDIFALETGNINLALTTDESYLNGIVDNGGKVNLWLQNGAVWTNEANNTRYEQDYEDVGYGEKSRVTNFYGGNSQAAAGVIYQTANSDTLTIDNYNGYATVLYEHDAQTPANILGGDVKIAKAAQSSNIVIRTDYDSNMSTESVQNDVLNALANKLYYNAYTTGENNLTGTVQIAEGLTAAAAAKYVGDIAFDAATGQGSLKGTAEPAPDPDPTPTPDPDEPEPEDPNNEKDNVTINKTNETWIGYNSGDNVTVNLTQNANWTNNNTGDNLQLTAQDSAWSGNNSGDDAAVTLTGSSWSGANEGANTTVTMDSTSQWTNSNTGADLTLTANGGTWNGTNSGSSAEINLNGGTWTGTNSGSNADVTMTNQASWTKDNTGDSLKLTMTNASWSGENKGANAEIILNEDANWTGSNSGTGSVTVDGGAWSGDNTSTAEVTVNDGIWTGANSANGSVAIAGGTWSGSNAAAGTVNLTDGAWEGSNNGTGNVTVDGGTWTGDNTADGTATIVGGTWNGNNAGTATINSTWNGDNSGEATVDADWTGANSGTATLNGGTWTGDNTADSTATVAGGIWNGNNAGTATITGGTWDGDNAGTATVNSTWNGDNSGEATVNADWTGANSGTATLNGGTWTGDNTADSTATVAGGIWNGNNAGTATITGGTWDGDNAGTATVNSTWNGDNSGEATVNADWTGANSGTATLNGGTWTGDNTANGTATIAGGIWSGDNTSTAEVTVNDGTWTGANSANGSVAIAGGTWSGSNAAAGTVNLTGGAWKGSNNGTGSVTIDSGTWSGDNTSAAEVTMNGGTWTGINSGADAVITMNDGAEWTADNTGVNATVKLNKGAAWTGNNSGAEAAINVADTTWNGTNEAADTQIILTDGAVWGGNNSGNDLNLTAQNSSWSGNNSGNGAEIDLNSSIWNGCNTGTNVTVELDSTTWTGYSNADGFSLTLNDSVWKNNGRSQAAKFAADNGVIDMTAANAGDITIADYSGKTIVLYSHDASNAAKVNGGNITIEKAAANSSITLRTDASGIDMNADDSIESALNAMANKLYYTAFTSGETNLSGYVEIAEGLTSTSVSQYLDNITYDAATGQGSYEIPRDNNEKDNVVINKTGEVWNGYNSGKNVTVNITENGTWSGNNFGADDAVTIDNSKWTGSNSGAETSVDLNNNASWTGSNSGDDVTVTIDGGTWSGNNAAAANGVNVTLTDGTWSGDNQGTNTVVNGTDGTWAGDNTGSVTLNSGTWSGNNEADGTAAIAGGTWDGDNAGTATVNSTWNGDNSGETTVDADWTGANSGTATLNGGTWTGDNEADGTATVAGGIWNGNNAGTATVNSTWNGDNSGEATVDADWTGANSGTATLNGGTWTGDNEADGTATIAGGTWSGDNAGTATVNSTWDGDNFGAAEITLNENTWSGDNYNKVTITGGKWTGDNSGKNSSATLSGTEWSGDNIAEKAAVTLGGSAVWSGDNIGGKAKVVLGDSTAVNLFALNDAITIWSGNNLSDDEFDITVGSNSEWSGYNNGDNAAVTINGGTWSGDNTDAADGVNVTLTDGTWSGDNQGTNTVVNGTDGTWTGDNIGSVTLNGGTWTGGNTAEGTATIAGGIWKGDNAGTATVNSTWNGDNSGEATVDADWTGANSGTATLNGGTWTGDNTADGTATITDGTWNGDNAGNATVKGTWNGNNSGTAEITLGESTWSGSNSGSVTITGGTWSGSNSGANTKVTLTDTEWSGNDSSDTADITLNSSTWTGYSAADNLDLTLSSSTWYNTNSTASASRISDLEAASGIIDMTASSQDLTIDNYSGNAVIIYKHDANSPTDIIGGSTTIQKAAAGSEITLRTDRSGLDLESDVYTDKNLVNAALNALANKLYYSAYTSGERNLSGQVEIAEGLTAAAVSKRLENISFDESTGQGQYEYEKAYPDQQIESTIETGIDGSEEAETVYKEAGILKADGSYQFTSDPTEIKAANTITADDQDLTVTAEGTLKLTADQTAITATGGQTAEVSAEELIISGQTGIKADSGSVIINGDTNITAVNGIEAVSGGSVELNDTAAITSSDTAISADGEGSSVTIADGTITGDIEAANGASVTINKAASQAKVVIDGSITAGTDAAVEINLNGQTSKLDGSISGEGSVDFTLANEAAWTGDNSADLTLAANDASWEGNNTAAADIELTSSTWTGNNSGAGSQVTLMQESEWEGSNTAAADIELTSSTWAGNNSGAGSQVTLTQESEWEGSNTAAADIELTSSTWTGNNSGADTTVELAQGSTWTGYSAADNLDLTLSSSTWYNTNSTASASRISDLEAASGIIDMTASSQDLTIDNYSGNAVIIYKHDANSPTDIIGGSTTIQKAAAGSEITLRTDRSGLDLESDVYTDKNLVNAALNALANKLYYSAYTSGERNLSGQVEIAEGLTAAAVSKRLENISFDESTGQGQYEYEKAYPDQQIESTIETGIDGSEEAETVYKEAGILKADGSYQFTSDPTEIKAANTITADDQDLTVTAEGTLKLTADQTAITATGGQTAEVSAEELIISGQTGIKADSGSVIINGDTNITAVNGIEAVSGGSVELNDTAAITSSDTAISADGEGSSVTIADGTITGDIEALNGASVTINKAASLNKVVIDGDVNVDDSSSVELNLGSDSSRFVGNLNGSGQAEVNLDNGAAWTGAYTGDSLALSLGSNAAWRNTNTDGTVIDTVSGTQNDSSATGTIDMTADNVGNLTINHYNGSATIIYKHDAITPTNILGGDTIIRTAAEGSQVTLSTDNTGIMMSDEDEVKGVLNNLANKLFYEESVQNLNNLTGKVQIAEGLVSSSASLAFGSMTYDTANNGQGNLVADSMTIINRDPDIIYGDSETAMMRGAKSAMASTAMMWRSENSDLMQRMGDLRLSGESGAWVKYYGGKYEMDAQKTNFSTEYQAYQMGYDKQVGNGWLVGTAVSYSDGESSYNLGGRGDNTVLSLSVYGTWNHQDGRYADIILKGSHLNNEYTVYNDMMHKLDGDYSTWGTSLSAQYGKYIERNNGFYIDPSVQLTIGRIEGKDYNAHSDFLDSKGRNKDMFVSQDSFNSVIGRLGIGIGKRTAKATYYAKVALAHEFAGDFTTSYAAENEPTSRTSIDFGDTWYEFQLGGTTRLSDNSLLYLSYERDFGGDVTQKWRVDAGFRFSF